MFWYDFCLLKVGFNQLINKLSFMRYWDFVLAISGIENNQVNKYVTYYPYQSIYQSWLWDVSVFNWHNKLCSYQKQIYN